MKYSRAVSSVPFSPIETCECVASFTNHCGEIVLLIAGAVLEEQLTEALLKPQLAVTTPFFEMRIFFLHLRCWRVHGLRI